MSGGLSPLSALRNKLENSALAASLTVSLSAQECETLQAAIRNTIRFDFLTITIKYSKYGSVTIPDIARNAVTVTCLSEHAVSKWQGHLNEADFVIYSDDKCRHVVSDEYLRNAKYPRTFYVKAKQMGFSEFTEEDALNYAGISEMQVVCDDDPRFPQPASIPDTHYAIHRICITEGKKDNVTQGLYQNLAQLTAAGEGRGQKRSFCVDLPFYGIAPPFTRILPSPPNPGEQQPPKRPKFTQEPLPQPNYRALALQAKYREALQAKYRELRETPTTDLGALMKLNLELQLLREMAPTQHHAPNYASLDQATPEDPGSSARFTVLQKARLCGWAGCDITVHNSQHRYLQNLCLAASSDKDALITVFFNKLRDSDKRLFQDFIVTNHTRKALKTLSFAPGVTKDKWHLGLGIMAMGGTTDKAHRIEADKRQLMTEFGPHLQMNMDQVKSIGTTAPQPPTTITELEIWLSRYCWILRHLFSERCDLYQRVVTILDQLFQIRGRIEHSHNSGDTQAKLCAHVIWELTQEAKKFFNWIVTPEDFEDKPHPYAQVQSLTTQVVALHSQYPVDYPLNAPRDHSQPNQHQRQGNQNSRGGQQGPGSSPADLQRIQMSRQHRLFRELLAPIPPENRRRLRLGELLRSQGKSLQWFAATVGLGPMECCNSQIFGACASNCQMRHGAVLDDNKVRQALPVLRQALQRHIPPATVTH